MAFGSDAAISSLAAAYFIIFSDVFYTNSFHLIHSFLVGESPHLFHCKRIAGATPATVTFYSPFG